MTRFKVELSSKARKFYVSCQRDMAKRLDVCFEELEKNPFHGTHIKRMKTRPQEWVYRYRIGDYRVLYEVFENEVIVLVVKIAARGDVYKGL